MKNNRNYMVTLCERRVTKFRLEFNLFVSKFGLICWNRCPFGGHGIYSVIFVCIFHKTESWLHILMVVVEGNGNMVLYGHE